LAAVATYISQLPMYVYHTRAGIGLDHGNCGSLGTCHLGGDKDISQMPAATAYKAMTKYLPSDITSWTRENHYWSGNPFRYYGDGQLNYMTSDGAKNGAMRGFAAVRGNEFIVAVLGIEGT